MIAELDPLPPPAPREGVVDRENPWPGLAAFREADSHFFHGRELAIDELLRRVHRERLTVLFGLSGLGKTSLLQAGLFPVLREENFLPVLVRLDYIGGAPDLVAQVEDALFREASAAGVETPAPRAGESLWEYLHRPDHELWSPRNRLVTPVVVFDQFEEIFTLGHRRENIASAREAFLAELADLVEGRPPARLRARLEKDPEAAGEYDFHRHPYKILLTLREDFLPELEELRDRMPSLTHNRMRLLRMSGEDALAVVAGAGGHLVEPAVAERIVRFVSGAREGDGTSLEELTTDPALLSVVCRELNLRRQRRGEERITSDLLEGDRKEILTEFYERGVADLTPAVRRFLEERLLTSSGYRDSVALENALTVPGIEREAIDRLVARRLLRIEERGGVPRIELTHDVLTGVVRISRDARREGEAREAAEAARREAEERERLAAAKLRRSRIVSAVLAASLVLALVAGIWAMVAEDNARQAQINASYETARSLAQEVNSKAESLAFLASVLRLDPGHEPARYLMDDLLLRRPWALPRVVLRHDGGLWGAASSDDGRLILTLTRAGAAQVWDAETGLPRTGPLRHGGRIIAAATSPDGSRFATAASDGEVRLWDADGRALGEPMRHDDWITSLQFTRDGRRILTTSFDRTARWWDAATGRTMGEPMRHDDWVVRAALSRDGTRLATASFDGVGKLWDAASGRPIGEPFGVGEDLRDLDVSADGSLVLGVTSSGSPALWDGRTGRPRDDLELPAWVVLTARFSPDGRFIALGDPFGAAALWDLSAGAFTGFHAGHGAEVTSVEFSSDGRRLLTVSGDDTANLWDLASGILLGQPLRHGAPVSMARFSGTDGTAVVTASADGTARVWDLRLARGSGHPLYRPPAGGWTALEAGGTHALVTSGGEAGVALRVHDTTTGAAAGPPIPLLAWPASALLATGGGRALAVVDGAWHLWDTATAVQVAGPLRHDDGPIEELRLGAGDRLAFTRSKGGSVRVWEVETGRPVGPAIQLGSRIVDADIDAEGKRLVTSDVDGAIRLWTLPDMEAAGEPMRRDLPVTLVRFLSNRHLLVAALDGQAWILDLVTDETTDDELMIHDSPLTEAALSADGSRLVTASLDGTVRVWASPEGTAVGSPIRLGHQVLTVGLSANGRRLITTDLAGRARLWDARTTEPLGLPVPHGEGYRSAIARDEGIHVYDARLLSRDHAWVTAGTEGAAILWESTLQAADDPRALAELAEAVSGFEVDAEGNLQPIADPAVRLQALRERVEEEDLPFVRWYLSDPWERTLTPFSEITVEAYLRLRLSTMEATLDELPSSARTEFEESVRAELEVVFPGHPLLRPPAAAP